MSEAYEKVGLTTAEIALLARAQKKRDYYYRSVKITPGCRADRPFPTVIPARMFMGPPFPSTGDGRAPTAAPVRLSHRLSLPRSRQAQVGIAGTVGVTAAV